MTLKEELKKLYEDSGIEKKRHFFDDVLPGALKETAKRGNKEATLFESDVKKYGITIRDIRKWCEDNGLLCSYSEPFSHSYNIYDGNITIYWG